MAKKLSLADKYALAKGNPAHIRTKGNSGSRSTAGSGFGFELSYRQKLPVERNETNSTRFSETFKKTSLPGSFGSPIKALHSTPTSTRRPLSMYKILPYLPQKKAFKEGYIANKVLKDRPWLQRNAPNTTDTLKRPGVLDKLRSFLTGFKPRNDEFKRLSESAKEELHIRPDKNKTYVSYDDIFAPRARATADFEFDEVDANVQLAKKSIAEQKLLKKEAILEKRIQQQSQEIQELRSKQERELYLTKASYEAQLAELNAQVRQLHELSENRNREIEKERLKEIEESVLKENESFLVYQKETMQMFEEMKQRLEEKEEELIKKEQRLQELYIKKPDASPVISLASKFKPSFAPESTSISMNKPSDSHAEANSSHNMSFAEINIEHVNSMSALNKEHVKVVNEIKRTEEQFNSLLSTLKKRSDALTLKRTLSESERELNSQLEKLASSLERAKTLGPTLKNPYKRNLDSLFSFLEEFKVAFAKDKLSAYELYDLKQLRKTDCKVKQLTRTARKKLAKRDEDIRELQSNVTQLLIDENNDEILAMEASIDGLRDISNLLQQQDIAISTLKQLATIQKKLDEIQLIMGDTE